MAAMDSIPAYDYVTRMNDFAAFHTELKGLFEVHGLIPDEIGHWLMIDGLYPAIQAYITGRLLYIEVALADDQSATEIYPAEGGLAVFGEGVFPVLLSAFWNRHNPGRVTRQVIKRMDGPWQIFAGLYQRQIEGERPPVPYLLFETIEAFLKEAFLDGNLHWLSTGIAVDEDGSAVNIKLDGERQPALEARIRGLDWIYDGRDYTLRNTILAVKA